MEVDVVIFIWLIQILPPKVIVITIHNVKAHHLLFNALRGSWQLFLLIRFFFPVEYWLRTKDKLIRVMLLSLQCKNHFPSIFSQIHHRKLKYRHHLKIYIEKKYIYNNYTITIFWNVTLVTFGDCKLFTILKLSLKDFFNSLVKY